MYNKFIKSVKYNGIIYNVVCKQTTYKGLEMYFTNFDNSKLLFNTWRNHDTLDGVLEKWIDILKDKNVEIFY